MAKDQEDLFRRVARQIYEKNGRDLEKTKLHLRARLRSDVKLLDAVIERELKGIVGIDQNDTDSQSLHINPEADGSQPAHDNQNPDCCRPSYSERERRRAAAPTPNSNQLKSDNQSRNVAVPVGSGDGQENYDNQDTAAVAASVPVKAHKVPTHKVKEFWRHPPRSEIEKEASKTARLVGSSIWRQFGMEKVRYREIDAFIDDMSTTGAMRVWEGISNIQRARFAQLIRQHGIPSDDSVLLSEVISDNEAAKLAALALSQAPKIAKELVKITAKNMSDQIKLIAAE